VPRLSRVGTLIPSPSVYTTKAPTNPKSGNGDNKSHPVTRGIDDNIRADVEVSAMSINQPLTSFHFVVIVKSLPSSVITNSSGVFLRGILYSAKECP